MDIFVGMAHSVELWEKKITITPAMLKLISEIDEFKGIWLTLGQIAPDKLVSLKKVATIESVASSTRIEGAKLSDSEVKALLANLNIKSLKNRDEEEIAGYADVMNLLFESYKEMNPSENVIK